MSNELHGDWYEICKDCGLMFPTGGTHTCPARHFVGSINVSEPVVDTTGAEYEFLTQETVERVLKALEDIASSLKKFEKTQWTNILC